MTEKYYPPIPGKIGKRGRPSLEEIAERKAYWEKQGGPPKSQQQPQQVSVKRHSAQELIDLEGNAVPFAAAPRLITSTPKNAQMTFKVDVPDDIQKVIESCPVELSGKDKKSLEKILEGLPETKRGRPSSADVEAKQNVKEQINTFLVEKIKENGGVINIQMPVSASSTESSVETPAVVQSINIVQFKLGDRVKPIQKHTGTRRRSKGIVQRQDIGDPYVWVRWNGGNCDWCRADTLVAFNATKQDLEEIMSEKDSDGDDE